VLQAPLIIPFPSVEADSYDRGASISLMRSSDIPTRRDYPAGKSGTSSGGIGLMPEDPEGRALVHTWMAFADDYFFPSVYRVSMGVPRGYSEDEFKRQERSSTMPSRAWSTN